MPKSHTGRTMLDRRSAILAGTAFIGAAAIPDAVVGAAEPGLAPAADFLAAARKFLASLEPDKRKAATFAWNGPEWSAWNYFGVGGYIKPGLRLEQMSAEQKAAAWDLLATWQSPGGLAKTKNVMLLQDVLAASGNGTGQRSSARRPRRARGAFASRATTSPSRSPCATIGSCRSPRPRSRPCPTASPAEPMPAW
jgi:Protein of unknown function (DUF3500)